MSRITIRLDDAVEKQLRDIAKDKGMTISEYCRNVLTESQPEPELTRTTIESEIDKLAREQAKFAEGQTILLEKFVNDNKFFSSLIYNFLVVAGDESSAKRVLEKAKKEVENNQKAADFF